ncbi:uncharacterized protein LOC134537197 [Bacillus rossius redtenbacheri]|uniref:uncharacterized protein LOC134537197 n=1 Tax=Bacillus rossius redtenbacheri TaxID=93214 RepID=UPI002FDEEF2B
MAAYKINEVTSGESSVHALPDHSLGSWARHNRHQLAVYMVAGVCLCLVAVSCDVFARGFIRAHEQLQATQDPEKRWLYLDVQPHLSSPFYVIANVMLSISTMSVGIMCSLVTWSYINWREVHSTSSSP